MRALWNQLIVDKYEKEKSPPVGPERVFLNYLKKMVLILSCLRVGLGIRK